MTLALALLGKTFGVFLAGSAVFALPPGAPAGVASGGSFTVGSDGAAIATTSAGPPPPSGRLVEVAPAPGSELLESCLSGEVRAHYASGIAATRRRNFREALKEVRTARSLAYRELLSGVKPPKQVRRAQQRLMFVEELLISIVALDEQLAQPESPRGDRADIIHARTLFFHQLYRAVRSFMGQRDPALLDKLLGEYRQVRRLTGRLKDMVQLGYAEALAESGDHQAATEEFTALPAKAVEEEASDLAIAAYYLAQDKPGLALARLMQAAARESWERAQPGLEEQRMRTQAYRSNLLDRLRDHPRFRELVTDPEER